MIRPRAARRGKLRSWLTDFPTSGSNRIEPVLRRYVDDGELPGYMLSISRRGREALFLAGGLMDVERGRRFERDAIGASTR